MIKKLLGYLIVGMGIIGAGYFKTYKGDLIPYPTLWFFICIIVAIIGGILISNAKSAQISKQVKFDRVLLSKLKQNGKKVVLTTNNCEIRENNYYEENLNESMTKAQMIDASFDSNRNYSQRYVLQSAIIYWYENSGTKLKLVSQSFPFGSYELTNYVKTGKVSVYIDKSNTGNYIFELED